ncbi:hypothetical protein CR513_24493, partial [Mucuna pruriens]
MEDKMQRMKRKRNQEQIMFSSNSDSKLLAHVQFFTSHFTWKLPIKVIQQHCKGQFNCSQTKCTAWAYPSSSTKRNVKESDACGEYPNNFAWLELFKFA